NDKVGMICFTDSIEKFITPKKGLKHILRIVREMISFEPKSKGTNIKAALQYLNEVINRKAVVFLVSDFLDRGFEKDLKITAKKHDLIALRLTDELEQELPDAGFLEIEDGETGETSVINTSDRAFAKRFRENRAAELETLKKLFKGAKVDSIDISTGKSYVKPLINFFRLRAARFK
ncbi:MAG: VWA domain-containing protein, partial [Candidatus Firestonebacteria bacterium]